MAIDEAFATFPALATQRLRLRKYEPSDATDLYAMLSDEETMRYYSNETFQSLAEVEAYIILRRDDFAQRSEIRWGIARHDDDRIIGSCGLHHFDEEFSTTPRRAISSIAPSGVRGSWPRRSPPC